VCFELVSSPPVPVISGAAVSHDELVLEASDCNRFAAFLATPEEPSDTGVVILPDVRGLYRFYEDLALRFAERGYPALAYGSIGLYSRPGEASDGTAGPVQVASQIAAPNHAPLARADANITAGDNDAFERALGEAGVEHELVVYEGAPHSFFDRKQEEFAAASEDAWARVLDFLERLH